MANIWHLQHWLASILPPLPNVDGAYSHSLNPCHHQYTRRMLLWHPHWSCWTLASQSKTHFHSDLSWIFHSLSWDHILSAYSVAWALVSGWLLCYKPLYTHHVHWLRRLYIGTGSEWRLFSHFWTCLSLHLLYCIVFLMHSCFFSLFECLVLHFLFPFSSCIIVVSPCSLNSGVLEELRKPLVVLRNSTVVL